MTDPAVIGRRLAERAIQYAGQASGIDLAGLIRDQFSDPRPKSAIRTAVVYRTAARALKPDIEAHNYGEPDQVQFEICQFSDGRVAQRWRIGAGSCVWWDKLDDLYSVHIYAHPDYGTRVEWSDGKVEQL